jgi:predicted anti-sigma-YlaC factor YlaD
LITCKEAVERLWDYLDRSLDRVEEAVLDAHLSACRHCCGELEFGRRIRAMLRGPDRMAELAPEVQARLEGFLSGLGEQP